ncbi:hypothetical protein QJS04_geneDACA007068 [Acorus gramineus]|uniref:INO80 complex subunit B-like conserved region domain-containing protein n=1 Tax=Acorus gramineus TaxID=55184 RepID=A0AAV9BRB3_ACOGR|nr:hypothetical protein QJS04_geneDACA007068 [Acorus gramineus]
MESLHCSGFGMANAVTRKRRSASSRRPHLDSQPVLDSNNVSSNSSTPSTDEDPGHEASIRRNECNLNSVASKSISVNKIDGFYGNNSSSRGGASATNDRGRDGSDIKRCREGVLAPVNWKSSIKMKEISDIQSRRVESHSGHGRNADSGNVEQSGEVPTDETKPRKVKLKLGGVTCTIQAKSNANGAGGGSASLYSVKPPRQTEATLRRQKILLLETSDDDQSPPEKGSSFQGGKDFIRGDLASSKKVDKPVIASSEPTRKSKRVPKRRVLDTDFKDGDEDDEMRYLERLRTSKAGRVGFRPEYEDYGKDNVKKQKLAKVLKSPVMNSDDDYGSSSRHSKDSRKKSISTRDFHDMDYAEEEELGSDTVPDMRKTEKKETIDEVPEVKRETSLTTRQRALQSGKDASSGPSASLIEFPNGLPPAPPRKQKEKLSEVEQQLKKAEAAQRRRLQVEKAAKESEVAEAIRKILGQDSSRKKREDKMRKHRDDLALERSANGAMLASDMIRWVSGPNGTVVTFATDVELPSIFESNPCRERWDVSQEKFSFKQNKNHDFNNRGFAKINFEDEA